MKLARADLKAFYTGGIGDDPAPPNRRRSGFPSGPRGSMPNGKNWAFEQEFAASSETVSEIEEVEGNEGPIITAASTIA
jgi:hypothetical protein